MSKAFESLSFADLSAMRSEVYQKMEWLRKKFPDGLDEMQGGKLTDWGHLSLLHSNIGYEIFERIEDWKYRPCYRGEKQNDDTKETIRRSFIPWLIANAKSEKMKALGISEEALSDAKEVADDLKNGGRPDRANAINRLIRAFFLSLDDVSFPKIDNG